MGLNAIVALVRNGLCCIKDLELFPGSILYDAKYTALYYEFPEPFMSKTTPLDLLIAIAQFYAFVTLIMGGYEMMVKGSRMRKVCKAVRWNMPHQRRKHEAAGYQVIEGQLSEDESESFRLLLEGFWIICVGVSFFWLTGNSLHALEGGSLGGVQGLIHALTIAELGLLVSLRYMVKDGSKKLFKSQKIHKKVIPSLVSSKGRLGKLVEGSFFDNITYSELVFEGWTPFWNTTKADEIDKNLIQKEVKSVQQTIDALLALDESVDPAKEEKLESAVNLAIHRLEKKAWTSKMEGYFDYLYFILNAIAFYGYLICVLVFYLPDRDDAPILWTHMKYGLSNPEADWTGNFAGDAMWTIEPFSMLLAPHVVSALAPSKKPSKVKKD